MLPVRWMSPESIRDGLFTPHTDVWSYGVTLWELSKIGGFPYQGLSNAEVLEKVDQGCTLEIPHRSSREMSALLRRCWSQEPLRRPNPSEIVRILIETPDMVHACIDVPGTTLLDNSMGKFDARKATERAWEGTESPQSNHSFPFDHVGSTMNLTAKQRDNRIARKHSTKPEATRTKWHSSKLWRKTSVQFLDSQGGQK